MSGRLVRPPPVRRCGDSTSGRSSARGTADLAAIVGKLLWARLRALTLALTLAGPACSFAGAMRVPFRLLFSVLGALLHVGCLPPDGTGTSSGSSGGASDAGDGGATTAAGRACLDTADAIAKASQRCGADYTAARNGAIRDLANGDCESVTIRNETELRTQCFPSLASISCADLTNQRFAPSCAEQLIRSK